MPDSCIEQWWERWGHKVKRPLILQMSPRMASSGRGYVNIILPIAIHRWTGSRTKAFCFNILAEGQGVPRQVIMYGQYPFSEQKHQKATGSSKRNRSNMESVLPCNNCWLWRWKRLWLKGNRQIPEAGKVKKHIFPYNLILDQWDPFGISDLQIC